MSNRQPTGSAELAKTLFHEALVRFFLIIATDLDTPNASFDLPGLAQRLAIEKNWLQPKHYETDAEQGFGTYLLHEEPDHTLAVFVVNWLPGRGAPPHDHGTWAVVAGVEGVERNIRYRRIDDRSRQNYAELEVKHDFNANAGDLFCMKTGGIHAVRNETHRVTMAFHTYGKHVIGGGADVACQGPSGPFLANRRHRQETLVGQEREILKTQYDEDHPNEGPYRSCSPRGKVIQRTLGGRLATSAQ